MADKKDEEPIFDGDDPFELFKEALGIPSCEDVNLIVVKATPLSVIKETPIAPGITLLTFIEPHLNGLITTRLLCADDVKFKLGELNKYGESIEKALKNHEDLEFYVRAELQF